jgi:hypothetical protein
MTAISIHVETASLRIRANGPATANMWLVINGREFPAHGWNDFVVVVLGWWATALLEVLRNPRTLATIHFMEGPYAVKVCMSPSGLLQLCAVEGSNRNIEVAVGEGEIHAFISGVISQSHEVLDLCRREVAWSNDAAILESSVDSLEKELSQTS